MGNHPPLTNHAVVVNVWRPLTHELQRRLNLRLYSVKCYASKLQPKGKSFKEMHSACNRSTVLQQRAFMAGTVQSFKLYFIEEYLRFSRNLVHQQVIFLF